MITTIINLLLINIIVSLVFLSGFVDEVDDAINRKWRFHHLPKPFSCALCSTFWAGIIYILVMGQFNILNIALCLANAHLTKVITPLWSVLENWLLKIISWIMPK